MRRIILYIVSLLLFVGLSFTSCKQLSTISRLKLQVKAQTEIIKNQSELIRQLTDKPTYQIKNEVKIAKKSTINNYTRIKK